MLDLTEAQRQTIERIVQSQVPECGIWVFGSRLTGHAKPFSDLDLAIICASGLSLARYAALKTAFEESDLPFRVDIVDWASLNEDFRAIIARNHLVLQSP